MAVLRLADAADAGDAGMADADAVGDDCPWRCLVPAAGGDGESEAGTLATAAWNGCPAQAPAGPAGPADPTADGSQAELARGAAVTIPDAGAGAEPRVR